MAPSSNIVIAMLTQKASIETRFQPLMFSPLTLKNTNFLEWVTNVQVFLAAEELDPYLFNSRAQDLPDAPKRHTLLILRRHLDPSLRQKYIQIDNHVDSWRQLHITFHHEQTIFLPQAKNKWINLKVLNFPDFLSLNSKLYCISVQLKLCDE